MYYVIFAITLIVIIYTGRLLALLWQCEYVPELEPATKYIIFVPLLNCACFFSFLLKMNGNLLVKIIAYAKLSSKDFYILNVYYQIMVSLKKADVQLKRGYRTRIGRLQVCGRETRICCTDGILSMCA